MSVTNYSFFLLDSQWLNICQHTLDMAPVDSPDPYIATATSIFPPSKVF